MNQEMINIIRQNFDLELAGGQDRQGHALV